MATSIMAIAIPGIPQVTGGDSLDAVISPYLNTAKWPDGYVGMRGDDVVVVAGKIVAKAQSRWHRAGAEPDGFRTRRGIPDKLGLKAPHDADAAAAELRRGLTARFGGRPGVIITASGEDAGRGVTDRAIGSAGLDIHTASGESVIDAIAALAGVVAMGSPDCPVVVVRGIPDVMTWEDKREA